MRLLAVRASGALGFDDLDLDLRGAGPVIGVRGSYAGQEGRSNRAGKSRLVYDLPLFALDGWSRTGNARDVVTRGRGEGWAEVEVETPGGVLRVRRTATLSTNGASASCRTEIAGAEGAREEEAAGIIRDRLGLPVEDLRRVSLFEQGDVMGFLGGDQKRTLMRWLDQDFWKAAEAEAGVRLREADRAAVRASDALKAARDAEAGLPALRSDAALDGLDEEAAADALRGAEERVRCAEEEEAHREAESALRASQSALDGAVREKRARVEALDAGLRAARAEADLALNEAKAAAARARRERTSKAREEEAEARVDRDRIAGDARRAKSSADEAVRASADARRRVEEAERAHAAAAREELDAGKELEDAHRGKDDAACHVTRTAPCAPLLSARSTERDALIRGAEERKAARKAATDAKAGAVEAAKKVSAEAVRASAKAGLHLQVKEGELAEAEEALADASRTVASVDALAAEAEADAVRAAEEAREDADASAVSTRETTLRFAGAEADAALAERDRLKLERDAAAEALRAAKEASGAGTLPELRRAAATARDAASAARVAVSAAEERVLRLDDLDAEAGRAERKARALRILRAAFGKDGIPARVVEGYIDDLAEDANEFMERLGMDARIAWRTWRELAKWREDCHACGSTEKAGRGASVRCGECGAPWRRARAEDFACVLRQGAVEAPLSSDSGGGKTLVALSVRFALSRLVSRARGVDVDSLVLDEPFAALDGPNLQAAVALVTGTLGAYGVRQVFLVSHLQELQDCVGDLITVVREGDLSRVETTW